jgi:hypothetical protein
MQKCQLGVSFKILALSFMRYFQRLNETIPITDDIQKLDSTKKSQLGIESSMYLAK